MSSSPYLPPTQRRITLVLDGSAGVGGRFTMTFKEPIRETNTLGLARYVVTNTPVTATVPNTPYLDVRFQFANGSFNLNPCVSNVLDCDSIPLLLGGLNTLQAMTPALPLGAMRSGHCQQVTITVHDVTGAPHDPSLNKLFNWCVIELVAVEQITKRTPDSLNQVPSIQQVWDTI